jgi:hypothetical protein
VHFVGVYVICVILQNFIPDSGVDVGYIPQGYDAAQTGIQLTDELIAFILILITLKMVAANF